MKLKGKLIEGNIVDYILEDEPKEKSDKDLEKTPASKEKIIICRIMETDGKDIKILSNIQLPFTENYKEIILKWLKIQGVKE